jgi:hypothetical protein
LRESRTLQAIELGWLSEIQVRPCQSIECSHHILDGETDHEIARSEELFFSDTLGSGQHILSLSESANEVLCEQVAIAIQRIMSPGQLTDLSPLAKILQCPPDRIESILDKFKIPRFNQPTRSSDETQTQGKKSDFFNNPDSNDRSDEKPEAKGDEPESNRGGDTQTNEDPDSMTKSGDAPTSGRQPTGSDHRADRSPTSTSGPGSGVGSAKPGWDRMPKGHKKPGQASKGDPKPKARLISYAATPAQEKEKEQEEDPADDELPINKEIGDWAVHWVLQYERQEGRDPKSMPHCNPGYDVESSAPMKPMRYIEVKGMDGDWDVDGVPLSPRQLQFARDKGDEFWLYVVEHERRHDRVKIHPIQNPNDQITQFRFDHGWKKVAIQGTTFIPLLPAVGMHIQWRHDGQLKSGIITSVGEMLQVKLANGHTTARAYEPLEVEILPR